MMHDAHNLFEYTGCSTLLARKDDPQTSKDAAKKMVKSGKLSRQEKMVYEVIQEYCREFADFTTKDIAKKISWISWSTTNISYDKAYDICRKRFSGLFNKFKIVLTGERRDGCRVWRLL